MQGSRSGRMARKGGALATRGGIDLPQDEWFPEVTSGRSRTALDGHGSSDSVRATKESSDVLDPSIGSPPLVIMHYLSTVFARDPTRTPLQHDSSLRIIRIRPKYSTSRFPNRTRLHSLPTIIPCSTSPVIV